MSTSRMRDSAAGGFRGTYEVRDGVLQPVLIRAQLERSADTRSIALIAGDGLVRACWFITLDALTLLQDVNRNGAGRCSYISAGVGITDRQREYQGRYHRRCSRVRHKGLPSVTIRNCRRRNLITKLVIESDRSVLGHFHLIGAGHEIANASIR